MVCFTGEDFGLNKGGWMMRKYLVMPVLVLMICFSGQFSGFCQYYNLDGKQVQINGPEDWDTIGIALDESACDKLIAIAETKDQSSFSQFLKNYDILRIPNGSSALVLDIKLLERKAKVMIFRTIYEGESGWVPLSWLDNNQDRPVIRNIAEDNYTIGTARAFY